MSQNQKTKNRRSLSKDRAVSSRKKTGSTYTLELLESRVLLSGDLAGAVQVTPIQPAQAPAQAVTLSVPAGPASAQQTFSVADMPAKRGSSFNQYAGESSGATSNAATHAPDRDVSKGSREAGHQFSSEKSDWNTQFVTPTVKSQPLTPQDSAVINGNTPLLQPSSVPQMQSQLTPISGTTIQSDMANSDGTSLISTELPVSQGPLQLSTAVNPVSQGPTPSVAPTFESNGVVSADTSLPPSPLISQTQYQAVSPSNGTTASGVVVNPVQTPPTSQIVTQPSQSQTISQSLVTPVSQSLVPAVQTATGSSLQQQTQPVSQPIASTTSSDAINPQLPQATVDTSMPTTSVTVRVGPHGDYTDLQTALNNVSLGTTILLEPGISYTSPNDAGFILPNKTTGTGWIVIRPDVPDSALPAPGTRATPADAALMPKIIRGDINLYAMSVAPGAHNYRIVGVEFMNQGNADTRLNGAFVNLDGREGSVAAQSNNITLDRVYIHSPSDPGTVGVHFGVILGGRNQAVIDSDIEGMHSNDGEAKAIVGWDGAGPWLITNNFLSASGENMMIGGATPLVNGLTPSDITITHNDFYKPLAWRDDPAYKSGPSAVLTKNLLEVKNAQRVLIDANVFENVWPDGQFGYAVVFTPKTGSVGSIDHWSIVADITFTNNLLKNCADGLVISGGGPYVSEGATQSGGRFLIENNAFIGLGGDYASNLTSGNVAQISNGPFDVQFKHNTVEAYAGSTIRGVTFVFSYGVADEGALLPLERFVVQDNIFHAGSYPLMLGAGGTSLATVAPGYIWTNNAMVGPWPTSGGWLPAMMPQGSGNAYPSSVANVGYTNLAGGDYQLASISPYKGAASDGKDIGVDWNQFNTANS